MATPKLTDDSITTTEVDEKDLENGIGDPEATTSHPSEKDLEHGIVACPPLESTTSAPGAEPAEPPFSIFPPRQKRFIVAMASLAALLSPLSASIYYPAMPVLATDLRVTSTDINVSVTTYLIFQGLAPTILGNLSDSHGRRPSYLVCFVLCIAANVGLALCKDYTSLLVLRCLQSSGSSATVALASAVVADVVTSAERGLYMGYATMGALLGPAVGPVIGGVLTEYLGWRSVFWFLAILAGAILVVYLTWMEETCRRVVGNGSDPEGRLKWWNVPLVVLLRRRKAAVAAAAAARKEEDNGGGPLPQDGKEEPRGTARMEKMKPKPSTTVWQSLSHSLHIFTDLESSLILLYSALLFTGMYMLFTSLPSLLSSPPYSYTTLQVGLVFIATGLGAILAAPCMGTFVDFNFRRLAKAHGLEIRKDRQQDLGAFPIERARLQLVLPTVAAAAGFIVAYGFAIQHGIHIAPILVFLFFTTFFLCGSFNALNTLIVDLNRNSPGGATAAMNLARCWLGAGGVAAVVPLVERVGMGWTGVVVAGIWVVFAPAFLLVMVRGEKWRREKREKEEVRAREQGETGVKV